MMNEVKRTNLKQYETKGSTELEVKLLEGAFPLKHGHDDDVGFDICSPEDVYIHSHSSVFVDSKVCIALPKNVAGMLKSKSGLNKNHGLIGEGVIDPGYTNSIGVKIYNLSEEPYFIRKGEKLIQICFVPVVIPTLKYVDTFTNEETERGLGGFGSTGK